MLTLLKWNLDLYEDIILRSIKYITKSIMLYDYIYIYLYIYTIIYVRINDYIHFECIVLWKYL